jgi:hypothetical protein
VHYGAHWDVSRALTCSWRHAVLSRFDCRAIYSTDTCVVPTLTHFQVEKEMWRESAWRSLALTMNKVQSSRREAKKFSSRVLLGRLLGRLNVIGRKEKTFGGRSFLLVSFPRPIIVLHRTKYVQITPSRPLDASAPSDN